MSNNRDLNHSPCYGPKTGLAKLADSQGYPDKIEGRASESIFENQSDLMGIEEVAGYLGLAPQTIRNWIAKRKIPFLKIGRRHVVRRGSLEAWIIQQEWKPWQ